MDLILDALQSQVSPDVVVYADAAVPLRPGVRFLPTLARGEWGSMTQARSGFAAVSLLGLYAVIVSRWVGEAIAGTWSGGAASVMAVQMLPIIASLQIVSPLRAQALRDRRQPDGRRRGVFIAPEITIFLCPTPVGLSASDELVRFEVVITGQDGGTLGSATHETTLRTSL